MKPRAKYGLAKDAVIEGQELGLSYDQLVAKYGIRKPSLYIAAKRLGISLKKPKNIK